MNRFKDTYIAQLFADERFSPIKQKIKMLETAEQLAAIVQPQQSYPFEFVCFKITGYRPDSKPDPHMIAGDVLTSDLLQFILAISCTISQPVQMITQPVYTVAAAAEKLGVSEKTVNRWRKSGLVSRSLIFEDGKRRIAILESSLNNFLVANAETVRNASKFSRLDEQEADNISEMALDMVQKHPNWSRQQLINKIAKSTDRSVETVRSTLIKKFSDGTKRFEPSPAAISPHQMSVIYTAYQNGTPVKELTKRFRRSKSSIYRIINGYKLRMISTDDIKYIEAEEFNSPRRVQEIIEQGNVSDIQLPDGIEGFPSDMEKIKTVPVLTRDREQMLFCLYNCLKFEAVRLIKLAKSSSSYAKSVGKIENLLKRAEKVKDVLACSNMRLVLSIANKHQTKDTSLTDLISDGYMALLRAIEGYNYDKGFRFSTYASLAIKRAFAKNVPSRDAQFADIASEIYTDSRRQGVDVVDIEQAGEDLDKVISMNLNEREQYIIRNHFGLDGQLIRRNFKTRKEIGENLGITAERVRQIELQALQKLRHCLSAEMFDELLG